MADKNATLELTAAEIEAAFIAVMQRLDVRGDRVNAARAAIKAGPQTPVGLALGYEILRQEQAELELLQSVVSKMAAANKRRLNGRGE